VRFSIRHHLEIAEFSCRSERRTIELYRNIRRNIYLHLHRQTIRFLLHVSGNIITVSICVVLFRWIVVCADIFQVIHVPGVIQLTRHENMIPDAEGQIRRQCIVMIISIMYSRILQCEYHAFGFVGIELCRCLKIGIESYIRSATQHSAIQPIPVVSLLHIQFQTIQGHGYPFQSNIVGECVSSVIPFVLL